MQATRARAEATSSLRAITPRDFGYEQARHLLLRAGFGGTPEHVRAVTEIGPERAVDALLQPSPPEGPRGARDDEPPIDPDIMAPPSQAEREAMRRARRAGDEDALARFRLQQQHRQRRDRAQLRDIQRWWLARLVGSARPLEEKITLFWHSHFATGYRKIENSHHMLMQNRLFRLHAVGSFASLLHAIIRDPAMLAYLDNHTSNANRPNENLARELMELFSLGEGAYTEQDVRDGARALTGYSFDHNDFVFRRDRHDNGRKRILGATGLLDGDGFVRAILAQPACADFIAWKLHRFFVNHDALPDHRRPIGPHGRVVRQLGATLRANNYDLRPVLRRLFLSEHFYDPANMGAQIKSPVELVAGAARTLGAPTRDPDVLLDALRRMGQDLFSPPSVAGWAGGRTWINTSTLFVRQNTLVYMLTGRPPVRAGRGGAAPDAPRFDPSPLLVDLERVAPGASRDPERVARHLLLLTLGEARDERVAPLVGVARAAGDRVTNDVVVGMLALIAAAPEHQLA